MSEYALHGDAGTRCAVRSKPWLASSMRACSIFDSTLRHQARSLVPQQFVAGTSEQVRAAVCDRQTRRSCEVSSVGKLTRLSPRWPTTRAHKMGWAGRRMVVAQQLHDHVADTRRVIDRCRP